MAEQRFDLETFLRAYMGLKQDWVFADHNKIWNWVVEYYCGGKPENLEGRYKTDSKSLQSVIELIEATNDKQNVRKIIEFVNDCLKLNRDSQSYIPFDKAAMLLASLREIEKRDSKLVYDVLKVLAKSIGFTTPKYYKQNGTGKLAQNLYRDIAIMLANSEHATLQDIERLIYFCERPTIEITDEDKNIEKVGSFKIINDVFTRAEEEVDDLYRKAEQEGSVVEPVEVSNIAYYAKHVCDVVLDGYETSPVFNNKKGSLNYNDAQKFAETVRNFKKKVEDRFDIANMTQSGRVAYSSSYEESYMTINTELEHENAVLKTENRRLSQSNDALRENNKTKEDRIKELEEQLEELKKQLQDEKNAKASAQEKVKKFSEAATAIEQAGAFKRGDALKALKRVNEAANQI